MSKEDAISLGCTGGTGRASGWANDVRKHHPYAMYGKVDFKEITYTHGDAFDRYMVRMDEIMESCRIIEQLIDNVRRGVPGEDEAILKLPEACLRLPSRPAVASSVCSSSAVETRRLTVCTTEAQAAVGACHGHRVSGREDSRPDCHRRYDGLRDTGY